MTIGVGVIGLGNMGRVHANNIAGRVPGASLAAVADARPESLAAAAAEFPAAATYADFRELVADERVDAVVVAANSTAHFDIVTAALERCKPIFCEKPLADTLARSIALHGLVEAAGTPFQLGFMRRFDPSYARAKRLIEAGEIGEPYHFYSSSRDPFAPPPAILKSSGGFFSDTGVHDFDLARWLMRSEIVSVAAQGGVFVTEAARDFGDVDLAHAQFRFASGALGSLHLIRNAVYGYDIRTEIIGTEGALQIGWSQATGTVLLRRGEIVRDALQSYQERFSDAYWLEMAAFADSVRTGTAPDATHRDGLLSSLIADAAARSLEAGAPVAPAYADVPGLAALGAAAQKGEGER